MNIETKRVRRWVSDYQRFGWEQSDTEGREGSGTYILVRNQDMPNYERIKTLEGEYFSLKRQKREYKPINVFLVAILFLLGIVPGVIYIICKIKQEKDFKAENTLLQKQMSKVLNEVDELI